MSSVQVYSESNLAVEQFAFMSKMQDASLTQGKTTGNHSCEKFSQEIYNEENALHSNHRRSESRMALEEEEDTD